MEALLNVADLNKAASVVQRIVQGQSNMPILSNVLIEAGENHVIFTANDYEAYVRCTVPAAAPCQAGRATVPAGILSGLARQMPSDALVSLKSDDLTVIVESRSGEAAKANNSYRLTGMPAEDYPAWPALETKTRFEVPQRVFKQMIDRTIYAVAAQDPRRVFMGELLELKDGRLRLVATDGKKLAWATTQVSDVEGVTSTSIVLPAKVLKELSGVLGAEGLLRITLGESQVAFDLEGGESRICYVSNRLEGRYPNYEVVVPREFECIVIANTGGLASLLRRAAVLVEDKSPSGAAVVMEFQPNVLDVTATSYDLGVFRGSIPVQYDGPKFEIAFHYKYVMETLKALDQPEVKICMKTASAPSLFLPVNNTEDLLYLVMPVKLSDLRPLVGADEGGPGGGQEG